MEAKTYFVSDLHLLTNRSIGYEAIQEILQNTGRIGRLILGGDIFDFCWSTHGSQYRSVLAALDWLEEICRDCPHAEIHYILGNHDYDRLFLDMLEVHQEKLPNFHWYHYFFRQGNSVFLHGDVIDSRGDSDDLKRRRSLLLDAKIKGSFLQLLYDLVVFSRAHLLPPHFMNRRKEIARTLLKYLNAIGCGPADGVEHVYFGHTHTLFVNYTFQGLTFHNSGAMIKGVKYHLLEVHEQAECKDP
jgi:UDP-2,3-diacylglucosamine hydrolase